MKERALTTASKKKLNQLLDEIEAERSVSPVELKRLMAIAGVTLSTLENLLGVLELPRGPLAKLSIADMDTWRFLRTHIGGDADLSSRISAAKTGQSHRTATSGGLLTVWPCWNDYPVVAIADVTGQWHIPYPVQPSLLLVENQELFIRHAELLSFVSTLLPEATLNEMDIAYGAGNSVTKAINRSFFGRYRYVYCLFDPDPGGADMALSLARLMSQDRVALSVLFPKDLASRLGTGTPLTDKQRARLCAVVDQATELNSNAGHELAELCNTLLRAGRWVEQEVYLCQ